MLSPARLTDRSIVSPLANTARMSASRSWWSSRLTISVSGRPRSPGMRLKILVTAGVKLRITRLRSRKIVAICELWKRFCRSVLARSSSSILLWSSALTVCIFLVDRLQLLLGGLELFVARLQLLVDREQLLVRSPELLIGG